MSKQYSAEQIEKAGAQAAQVLGTFINIASEIGREFNKQDNAASADPVKCSEDELRLFGEQLRQFRETAGYTVDGLARALEEKLNNVDIADKINSVENGQIKLPPHWLQAIADLLRNSDVEVLFGIREDEMKSPASEGQTRIRQLAAIFENDTEIAAFTDREFEKLIEHVRSAYGSAKTLIRD